MAKKPSPAAAMVAADVHLQKRAWRGRAIEGDAYFAFEQLITDFLNSPLRWFFLLGDVLDKKFVDSSPVVFLLEQIRRVQAVGKTIGFLQGQHELADVLEEAWMRAGGATCVHMHRKLVTIGPLRIYGLDYQPAGKLQEELELIPAEANVLLCHQVWADLMGSVTMPQGEFAQIRYARTILTGDKHQSEIHDWGQFRGKDGQELYVYSPGATYQTTIDEPNAHSYGILREDGTVSRFGLSSRKCDEYTVGSETELEEFLRSVDGHLDEAVHYSKENDLPETLHKPLWRITYPSRLLDLEQRITKIVAGRAHLFWKEIRPEPSERGIKLRKDQRQGQALTLKGCLAEEVDQEKQPEVFQLCQRLLDAGDSEEEITAQVEQWRKEKCDEGS